MSVAEEIIESLATGAPLAPQTKRSIRTYPLILDGQKRRVVECGECGDAFAISSRAIRAARAQNRILVCSICRKPATVRVTLEHRSYWINRMSQGEIVVLAESIWGPREAWRASRL